MRRVWSLADNETTHPQALPHVVVIGAGMAGLVSARLLKDSGFLVTVLEARARLGGRIWTDFSLGVPIDLGGSWIHGADDNPLSNWCKALGIKLAITSDGERYWYEGGRVQARSAVWRRVWQGRLAAKVALSAAVYYQRARRWFGQDLYLSLADAINPILASRWLPELDRRVLASIVATSEGVQGAPAEFLAVEDWFPKEAHGVNAIPVGGYQQLIDDAAGGLDIRLNQAVEKVVYTGDRVYLVTQRETIGADLAVVTVPLGILQQGKLRFDPTLPSQKQAAISRIGYGGQGVLGKITMRFAQRFWPADKPWLISLPPSPEERGVFTTWLSLEAIVGAPVLLAVTGGHAAVRFDRRASDEEVCSAAMSVLNRMFPGQTRPPERFVFTRWLSDPWALGSYSYPAVGSPLADRDLYAEPIADRVYFAGEGTQKFDFGTVHAALRSGEQVAREIYRRYTGREPVMDKAPWYV